MKGLVLSTVEGQSRRFDLLCEALEVDTVEDTYTVRGHLMCWFEKWSADPATDSGLLWDVSERQMGLWAHWSRPLVFGRALAKAGYVSPIESIYPAELVKGRPGFVVAGYESGVALDTSWNGVHYRRTNAQELVLYLTNPKQRARQMETLGVVVEDLVKAGKVPADWAPQRGGTGSAQQNGEAGRDGPQRGQGMGGGLEDGLDPGIDPSLRRKNVTVKESDLSQRDVPSPVPPPRQDGTGMGRKPREKRRKYRNDASHGTPGTGNHKSSQMLLFVREEKYNNPLACLQQFDGTDKAMGFWKKAVDRDVQAVMQVLANMTETDEAWAKIMNPAAVASFRLKEKVKW